MKRSPITRSTPIRPSGPPKGSPPKPLQPSRRPIARRPRRERDPAPDWEERRKALYARAGGRCELDGCSLDHHGMHAHHRKLRSRGLDHGLHNLAALAPACHRWVHENPAAATERGFMVPASADPATTPQLLHDGRLVHLATDGTYIDREVA